MYEKLVNGKNRVWEEDKKIRDTMMRKLCKIDSEENFRYMMNILEHYLRNKTRAILIIKGNYLEEIKETEQVIVQMMKDIKPSSP